MDDISRIQFETDLLKATDYMLLNVYSMKTSGLYWGKSGVAIVLFEVAKYLQNKWIEDHALEIFNQSLLSRTEKCGLKNGLAGIAYSFRYLLDNNFIEADLTELFDIQMKRIECDCLKKFEEKTQERDAIFSIIFSFTNQELEFKSYLLDWIDIWLNIEISELVENVNKIGLMASFPTHLWLEKLNGLIQILYFAKRNGVFILKDQMLFEHLIYSYLSKCDQGLLSYNMKLVYFGCIATNIDFWNINLLKEDKSLRIQDDYLWDAFSLNERIFRCQIQNKMLGSEKVTLNNTDSLIDSVNKELSLLESGPSLYNGMGHLLLHYISEYDNKCDIKRIDKILLLPD